jgi:hypothetical protein
VANETSGRAGRPNPAGEAEQARSEVAASATLSCRVIGNTPFYWAPRAPPRPWRGGCPG